jgi:hypothetical protein
MSVGLGKEKTETAKRIQNVLIEQERLKENSGRTSRIEERSSEEA